MTTLVNYCRDKNRVFPFYTSLDVTLAYKKQHKMSSIVLFPTISTVLMLIFRFVG